MQILNKIKADNPILYWLGMDNIVLAIILLVYMPFNPHVVLGLNSVIKPIKFAASSAIFAWTMAIFLPYINYKSKVRAYNWAMVIVLGFEVGVITVQALRGQLSHFNISSWMGAILFSLMGIAIVTLMVWTAYIALLFFKQKQFDVPMAYIWGIRFGLIIFVIFSMQGGMMASRMAHTVGAPDGGAGIPFFNWSGKHGDLRIAHFMGIHALQIVPLFGYLLSKHKNLRLATVFILLFSLVYIATNGTLLLNAMHGLPL